MNYTDKELLRASQIAYYTVNEDVINDMGDNTNYSLQNLYNNSDTFKNSIYKNISDVAGLGDNFDYKNGDFNYENMYIILNSISDEATRVSVEEMYEVVGEIINGGEIADWTVVSFVDCNASTEGGGIGVMEDGTMQIYDTPATDNGMGAIVLDTGDNSAILAFRGSDAMDSKDATQDWIASDLGLALGDDTPQQNYVEEYLYKINGLDYSNIAITGHSLGGNLAMHAIVAIYEEHPELARKVTQVLGLDSPGCAGEYFNNHSEAFTAIAESDNLSVKHYEWSVVGSLLEQPNFVEDSFVATSNDNKANFVLCHDLAFLLLDGETVIPGEKNDIIIFIEEFAQHTVDCPAKMRPESTAVLLFMLDYYEAKYDETNDIDLTDYFNSSFGEMLVFGKLKNDLFLKSFLIRVSAKYTGNAISSFCSDLSEKINNFFSSISGTASFPASKTIIGGNGDDNLYDREFENLPTTIMGLSGNDSIAGGSANDNLYGGFGNDSLSGRDGDDFITGEYGNDRIIGGNGNDILYGDHGDDTIYGDDGNDKIYGGTGNDILNGGAGSDTYYFEAGFGNDTVTDSASNGEMNTIVLGSGISSESLYTELSSAYNGRLKIDGSADSIDFSNLRNNDSYRQFVFEVGGKTIAADAEDSPFRLIKGSNAADTLRPIFNDEVTTTIYAGGGNDTIYGAKGADVLYGEDGDDAIYGEAGNDEIYGGKGNDKLNGGAGSDTYYFEAGFGNDTVTDSASNGEMNIIKLGSGISSESLYTELSSAYNGRLKIDGSADSIDFSNLRNNDSYRQFVFEVGGKTIAADAEDSPFRLIKGSDAADTLRPIFNDEVTTTIYAGGGNDTIYGAKGADVLYGEDGDDTINGEAGNDEIYGGKGNDKLNGGAGSDTYYFEAGFGNDTVTDYASNGEMNIIKLGSGISSESLYTELSSTYNGRLKIDGSADSIDFSNLRNNDSYRQFVFEVDGKTIAADAEDSPFRLIKGSDAAETLRPIFNDEVTTTIYAGGGNDTIYGAKGADVLYGEDGDDAIYGEAGNDEIYGGKGNDILNGGAGSDTYYFEAGFGNDTVTDYASNGEMNIIKLGSGISSESLYTELSSTYNGRLKIDGSADSIDFSSLRNNDSYRQFVFEVGGKTIAADAEDSPFRLIKGSEAAETLYPIFNDEVTTTIYAGGGNDTVYGAKGADVLYGEDGDDIIEGRNGNDEIYGGKGNDILNGGAGSDTYYFEAGFGNDTVTDSASNGEMNIIKLGSGISSESLYTELVNAYNGRLKIDGSADSIDFSNLRNNDSYRQFVFEVGGKTIAADAEESPFRLIKGSNAAETLRPIFNDEVTTTIYAGGGNDTIYGAKGADVLYGEDGDDTINSEAGNDEIYGGKGNDKLNGGAGSDTYYFEAGFGNDTVTDSASNGEMNIIKLGSGISSESLYTELSSAYNGRLKIDGSADSIDFSHLRTNDLYRQFVFEVGGKTIAADAENSPFRLIKGSNAADTLRPIFNDEVTTTIYAGGGNDTIYGAKGADVLYGEDGDDTINGEAGNDEIYGGKGNDKLNGGAGSDTYYFEAGFGNDTVTDSASNGEMNIIKLGSGISSESLYTELSSAYNGRLKIDGSADSIDFSSLRYNDSYRQFVFEVGGKTIAADAEDSPFRLIKGSDAAETLHPIFNDEVTTTIYAGGGNDTIYGAKGADVLYGEDGDDTIYGEAGNDEIYGGKGNDSLYGGAGNDTYYFNLGDSNDVINDCNGSSDSIRFGNGISIDDIIVGRTGNDMILKICNNANSIRLINQYSNDQYRIENFYFADGTMLTADDFLNSNATINGSETVKDYTGGFGTRDSTLIGSDQNDTLYGYDGDDTLIGGAGDDILYGGTGDDKYIFNLGDGSDTINEQNSNSANDTLVFGEGISTKNLFAVQDGNNLMINILGTDDCITVINHFSAPGYTVENFMLSDGRYITDIQLNQLIQSIASFENETGMLWNDAIMQNDETAMSIIDNIWIQKPAV